MLWVQSFVQSFYIRRSASRTPANAALLQFAQALLLPAKVDRDPDNQQQHHRRDQRIGGHDKGRIGTKRHRVTPNAGWLASSASCAPGGAGSRCASPPDAT